MRAGRANLIPRLTVCALLYTYMLITHLGIRDKRKGSHLQKSHGSWSPNNPLKSKRASRLKSQAAKGRSIASPNTATPDPGERLARAIEGTDVTPKQADYLKSLLDKGAPSGPSSLRGDRSIDEHLSRPAVRDGMLTHALRLNAPLPKNSQDASKLIDDLKTAPSFDLFDLEDDELTESPEDFPDWYPSVVASLQRKYGSDLSGTKEPLKKRWDGLTPEERDDILKKGNSALYRHRVLNPVVSL